MTKRVGLLSAWLAATLALGFVGYGAVALVGNQVTDQPTGRVVNLATTTTLLGPDVIPSPSVVETTDADILTDQADGDSESALVPDLSPVTSLAAAPTTPTPTSPSAQPPTTQPATTTPPATPPATSAPGPTTTTTTTTLPADDDDDDEPGSGDQTPETGPFGFTSEGGVVTVMCKGDQVRFRGASPFGGASVSVISRGPEEVEVRFQANDGDYVTTVTCDDGKASAEFD